MVLGRIAECGIKWFEGTVMRMLHDGGYQGAVGLEFWPTVAPDEALRRSMEVLAE